jgi:two-component system chemotaxis response regulator CheY
MPKPTNVSAPRAALRKILVVDDSEAMRAEVANALRSAGFEAIEARDGIEALSVIEETPNLALIVLDVNMPRLNGLEVLEAMRARGLPSIATVMLTTEAQTSLIQRAKAAGAKGWLVKPIKREHLVAVARRLIEGANLTQSGTTFVVPPRR